MKFEEWAEGWVEKRNAPWWRRRTRDAIPGGVKEAKIIHPETKPT
jgi:hypothetical protein